MSGFLLPAKKVFDPDTNRYKAVIFFFFWALKATRYPMIQVESEQSRKGKERRNVAQTYHVVKLHSAKPSFKRCRSLIGGAIDDVAASMLR
jgi:hypothetical protein